MLKGFICPNNEQTLFNECLKKCKMSQRCLSLPTLKKMSLNQREWTGKATVTQLIKGTREAYLEIKHDYYINPMRLAYSLLGSGLHASLEDSNLNMEKRISNKSWSGQYDYYNPDDQSLTDYKLWGSYKVAKALGIIKKKIPSPNGERYKKSGTGYKAGDIKMVNIYEQDPNQADIENETIQLNAYRQLIEKELNIKIKNLYLEIYVRDSGLQIAASRGIDKEIYIIEVPIKDVNEFLKTRNEALLEAIGFDCCPKCNDKESWGGRKCEDYCDVKEFCDQMEK